MVELKSIVHIVTAVVTINVAIKIVLGQIYSDIPTPQRLQRLTSPSNHLQQPPVRAYCPIPNPSSELCGIRETRYRFYMIVKVHIVEGMRSYDKADDFLGLEGR